MKRLLTPLIIGAIIGIGVLLGITKIGKHTSTSTYCMSCHAHPHADNAWKKSTHYLTENSGMRVACVECHLPPKGEGHWPIKIKMGARDIWSHWFKDSASINWEAKQLVENAVKYIPEKSCTKCHVELFSPGLTESGEDAHLYYKMKKEEQGLHCINCHLHVGHYKKDASHGHNKGFGQNAKPNKEIYIQAAIINQFADYTETIPGTTISFKMKAIEGGEFMMGSPEDEPHRDNDEGPQVKVKLSSFFMAEIETTWDEFMAFYVATGKEGRTTDTESDQKIKVDAITGPTPPYGSPDRGWGMGQRPAISMSYHAIETYCKWLSEKTGKKYRLPTEAEWEYAARGGTSTPYYFEGSPKKFQKTGLAAKLGKNELEPITRFEIYSENALAKTQLPDKVEANPFGLKNMLGNVAEFCSDFYNEEQFSRYSGIVNNPTGPATGSEHVVKGGSYLSDAGDLRCASRASSETKAWLRTDPQMPKSIWWYSDCFHVGFRVVCDNPLNNENITHQ